MKNTNDKGITSATVAMVAARVRGTFARFTSVVCNAHIEDATQDAIFKLWLTFDATQGKIEHHAKVIATQVAIDHLRHRTDSRWNATAGINDTGKDDDGEGTPSLAETIPGEDGRDVLAAMDAGRMLATLADDADGAKVLAYLDREDDAEPTVTERVAVARARKRLAAKYR